MLRSIKSLLFSVVLLVAVTSCEKEVSLENGIDQTGGSQSGTAVFSLDGAPAPCVTPLISGNYVVGTPLDISNSVVITVNVTMAGTYVISTGLINGIQFSGAGTFAATGPQAITLFGTGTPITAINASYIPGTTGCSFLISATTSTVTPVGGLFYEATIDGVPFRVDLNGTNGYTGGTSVNGTVNDVTLSSTIAPSAIPRPTGTTMFELSKGILRSYSTASNVTFSAFFSAGTSPFGVDPLDGVEIVWGDAALNEWSTSNGSADQTGSVFTITSVADQTGQPNYTVRVTATFNCKLYDGAGNSKTLTNGKYVGLFSKL